MSGSTYNVKQLQDINKPGRIKAEQQFKHATKSLLMFTHLPLRDVKQINLVVVDAGFAIYKSTA